MPALLLQQADFEQVPFVLLAATVAAWPVLQHPEAEAALAVITDAFEPLQHPEEATVVVAAALTSVEEQQDFSE